MRLDIRTIFEVVLGLYSPMKQDSKDEDSPERHPRQDNFAPDSAIDPSATESLDLLPTAPVWSGRENALATDKRLDGEQYEVETGWQDADGLPDLTTK